MIVGRLRTFVVHLLQELYRWFTWLLVGALGIHNHGIKFCKNEVGLNS